MTVWDILLHPLTVVKLVWILAALAKMTAGVRCWWLLRRALHSPHGRRAAALTRTWGGALVTVAGCSALVGAGYLAVGLYALSVPPPPGPVRWTSLIVPAAFILVALLGARGIWALDRGYKRVVRREQ